MKKATPGRRTPAKKAQRADEMAATREKILKAAQRILVRRGFRELTIRKLAAAIGYSAGAIYLYFDSREAIARELCLRGYTDLLARLEQARDAAASAEAAVRAVFRAYVDFGLEQPEVYRLIFIDEPEYLAAVFADRPADDPATGAYETLIAVIQALPCAGRKKPGRTLLVERAETCWAAMHGIVSLKLNCPGFPTAAPDTLGRVALDAFLKDWQAT